MDFLLYIQSFIASLFPTKVKVTRNTSTTSSNQTLSTNPAFFGFEKVSDFKDKDFNNSEVAQLCQLMKMMGYKGSDQGTHASKEMKKNFLHTLKSLLPGSNPATTIVLSIATALGGVVTIVASGGTTAAGSIPAVIGGAKAAVTASKNLTERRKALAELVKQLSVPQNFYNTFLAK